MWFSSFDWQRQMGVGGGIGDNPPSPVNTVAPALSETTPETGVELSVSNGTWTNPGAFSYQWYQAITDGGEVVTDGGNPTGTPISGATSADYTPVVGDEGKLLFATVTSGGVVAYSNVSDASAASAPDASSAFLTFDGTDSKGVASRSTSMEPAGDFTVLVRARASILTNTKLFPTMIANRGGSSPMYWTLARSNTNLYATVRISANNTQSDNFGPISLDTWFNFAARRSGTEWQTWANGSFVGTPKTVPTTAITDANMYPCLGEYHNTVTNGRWEGDIEKAAYFNSALSSAQIAAWFASEDVTTNSPDHAWAIVEGSGSTTEDAVGSVNFTLTDTTWGAP